MGTARSEKSNRLRRLIDNNRCQSNQGQTGNDKRLLERRRPLFFVSGLTTRVTAQSRKTIANSE
eukprot:scaffold58572_cov57-Attheya_sp.AAC.1